MDEPRRERGGSRRVPTRSGCAPPLPRLAARRPTPHPRRAVRSAALGRYSTAARTRRGTWACVGVTAPAPPAPFAALAVPMVAYATDGALPTAGVGAAFASFAALDAASWSAIFFFTFSLSAAMCSGNLNLESPPLRVTFSSMSVT